MGSPRLAGTVAYALVAWSFLVEIVGARVGASHWLLDTSVLTTSPGRRRPRFGGTVSPFLW